MSSEAAIEDFWRGDLSTITTEVEAYLGAFLSGDKITGSMPPAELESMLSSSSIPSAPLSLHEHMHFLKQKIIPQAINVSSPKFVGHMCSSLPDFMYLLNRVMVSLNQNVVKMETSKSVTPLERQVISMLHNLIYQREETFYQQHTHSRETSLGSLCSGGTVANITSLWAARNRLLPADGNRFSGIRERGVAAALAHYGYRGMAVLVSQRGHYSLAKAADILGIGRRMCLEIATDGEGRICLEDLRHNIFKLQRKNIALLAIVGVAGTTETGNIDPLYALADIAQEVGCHFHVDAAWGGVALFSPRYRHLLRGIERADSVTIDAHKQLYCPMGVGGVIFKKETYLKHVGQEANYILRSGSRDLGKHTLEGSRAGMAMLLHASLHILGRKGLAYLLETSIAKAKDFALMIEKSRYFMLATSPVLNILTYRYCPEEFKDARDKQTLEKLNAKTASIQRKQRSHGQSFVSRTRLNFPGYPIPIMVLRAVLSNPMTTRQHLREILQEQEDFASA